MSTTSKCLIPPCFPVFLPIVWLPSWPWYCLPEWWSSLQALPLDQASLGSRLLCDAHAPSWPLCLLVHQVYGNCRALSTWILRNYLVAVLSAIVVLCQGPPLLVWSLCLSLLHLSSTVFVLKLGLGCVVRPLPFGTVVLTVLPFLKSYTEWVISLPARSLPGSCRHNTSTFRFTPGSSTAMVLHMTW